MIVALAGYKTHNIGEVPEILHVGDNGVKLLEVASQQHGKGFVRLRRFQLDHGIPVSLPSAPVAVASVGTVFSTESAAAASDESGHTEAKKAEARAKRKVREAAKKAEKSEPTT